MPQQRVSAVSSGYERAWKCLISGDLSCTFPTPRPFARADVFVGSGVIEAGGKGRIGSRCKQSGMSWTVRGANAMLALRCCQISGGFEHCWEARRASMSHTLLALARTSSTCRMDRECFLPCHLPTKMSIMEWRADPRHNNSITLCFSVYTGLRREAL